MASFVDALRRQSSKSKPAAAILRRWPAGLTCRTAWAARDPGTEGMLHQEPQAGTTAAPIMPQTAEFSKANQLKNTSIIWPLARPT